MKKTVLLFSAALVCGCEMYMADVNKDIPFDIGEMRGRYYMRSLHVSGDLGLTGKEADRKKRQNLENEKTRQEFSIRDAIRDELERPPLDRFFQEDSVRSHEAMPVDIDVQINWREPNPSGFFLELSNLVGLFSLSVWPIYTKEWAYEIRVTMSSDGDEDHREIALMEMTRGGSMTPVVAAGLLARPDYFWMPLSSGSDEKRKSKAYQRFLSEQVALMVKSLCAKLPEKYMAWRARQTWFIEEQDRKASEAAYAAFADGKRSAADRLESLKKVTNESVLKNHAVELADAFKSETDAALREELFKRIDASTLTTLPYDELMVTRWKEIQTNAQLLAEIYTHDYERLAEVDRTELAKRLRSCSPDLVEQMVNAPTSELFVTNGAAWFTLLCEAPCKTRKAAIMDKDFLRRVPAEACESVKDSKGKSRMDLKRDAAKTLMDGFEDGDLIAVMVAASPSLTVLREEIFKRIGASTLTTLPYDALMVTRWKEIQTNAHLLAEIYTHDYERLAEPDRTELAKRLRSRSPDLVEQMVNAPTSELFVTNSAAWFTLLREAPCKTRKAAVMDKDFLHRVPAAVCEVVKDSDGESRMDLKRDAAKALLARQSPSVIRFKADIVGFKDDDDFIDIMAASPSMTIRDVAMENVKDFDLILKRIREGGNDGAVLAQVLCAGAVARKNWKVLFTLAQMYEQGLGVTKSESQAFAYYRMVAESGDADSVKSWLALGRFYEEGRGVEASAEQAATCYLSAAKSGNSAAQIRLADLFVQGKIGEHFFNEKVEWLQDFKAHLLEIDREEQPRVDYLRGILCETKAVVETDDVLLDCFRRAANRGIVKAQIKMGEICENGLYGVKPSWSSARNWYKAGGDEGVKRLAAMAAREEAAVSPYCDAAARGEAWAMYKLGRLYLTDDGMENVEQDWDRGIGLIRKAAEKGYPNAQFVLGMLYGESEGHLPCDPTESVKWWRKAADQGFADAEYMLGLAYFEGHGVPKSIPAAIGWWTKAAVRGHEAAIRDLNQVRRNLSNIFDRL